MTIAQALQLNNHTPPPSSKLDKAVLLSFVLKKPKEFLYTYPERKLTFLQTKKFERLLKRRLRGEPIAYLIGRKEFFGLDFFIDKKVLIPRPETELVVEEASYRSAKGVLLIADIGTGSGCMIISLAKLLAKSYKLKAISYYATDISRSALQIAQKNARRHHVNITFLRGDLLTPLQDKKIDLLIANLPYGWAAWKNNTSTETVGLKFEPAKALFTDEKGLKIYHRLFEQIAEKKYKPKIIILEFDPRQTENLKKLAKKYLPRYRQQIKKDLAGLNRILILQIQCIDSMIP